MSYFRPGFDPMQYVYQKIPCEVPPAIELHEISTVTFNQHHAPFCECCIKHKAIQDYTPFHAGMLHPFAKPPDYSGLGETDFVWQGQMPSTSDNPDKVIAVLSSTLPDSFVPDCAYYHNYFFIQPRGCRLAKKSNPPPKEECKVRSALTEALECKTHPHFEPDYVP